MTKRERFLESLLFGKPDRVFFSPGGPRESTLKRWHSEGLPEGADWRRALAGEIGIENPSSDMEKVSPGVSFTLLPEFEEKVLEHRNGHNIVQTFRGEVVEISDEFDPSYTRSAKDFVTRKWHKLPVGNEEDFERMKERFDPDTPGRFPADFAERCLKLKDRDYPVRISFPGPFWQLRDWCGFENLCMMMVEKPDFVLEMALFWKDFVLEMLERIFSRTGVDDVGISEDMACKEKSMISPAMAEKFLLPAWSEWVDVIKVGRLMAYRGGMDKRLIARGGPELESEMKRIIPPLLEDGGYIPSCDHGVPPDISWRNFVEYSRTLAGLTGWL